MDTVGDESVEENKGVEKNRGEVAQVAQVAEGVNVQSKESEKDKEGEKEKDKEKDKKHIVSEGYAFVGFRHAHLAHHFRYIMSGVKFKGELN